MANENSSLVSDIYHSRNNLMDIMEERGFNVDDYNHFSITEVNAMNKNEQLDLLLTNVDDSKGKIYVKYNLVKGLRPANVDDMIEELYEMEEILDKKDELLIITRTEPNDTLEKHLEKIWLVKNIYVNILCLNRLRFNILNHTYVPKHEVVPKKEIMSRYNMKSDSQFPEISRFDPVAIVLGIRPGELCKITRSSITAIEADYYRLCI
jgi:DNA-directed RNA polymerase subunit H (RpoH/RPB5)|tara:strand:+ start:510 stop:1133 length:624 start_codon:yes stop_codon:yes gene_type:complete